jgi:hypothetical protein
MQLAPELVHGVQRLVQRAALFISSTVRSPLTSVEISPSLRYQPPSTSSTTSKIGSSGTLSLATTYGKKPRSLLATPHVNVPRPVSVIRCGPHESSRAERSSSSKVSPPIVISPLTVPNCSKWPSVVHSIHSFGSPRSN